MSLFVLDTDLLSLLQRGHAVVGQRVAAHPATDLALTVITAEEQVSGRIASIRHARGRAQVALTYGLFANTIHFLGAWPLLELTEAAIDRFDQLRALRLNVGSNDLRIAAIVLENGATLVTRNLRDFGRVPGLACEDWSV